MMRLLSERVTGSNFVQQVEADPIQVLGFINCDNDKAQLPYKEVASHRDLKYSLYPRNLGLSWLIIGSDSLILILLVIVIYQK